MVEITSSDLPMIGGNNFPVVVSATDVICAEGIYVVETNFIRTDYI